MRPVLQSRGAEGVAEIDDALFGPKALGARLIGNEAAMAAVFWGDEADGGNFVDFCGEEARVQYEGIVLGGDEQEGHANLSGDALGADVIVIVLSVAIAKLRCGDEIVELADSSDRSDAVELVALRK